MSWKYLEVLYNFYKGTKFRFGTQKYQYLFWCRLSVWIENCDSERVPIYDVGKPVFAFWLLALPMDAWVTLYTFFTADYGDLLMLTILLLQLEEQLMFSQQRELKAKKEIAELQELVGALGDQNNSLSNENNKLMEMILDTWAKLADMTEMAEHLDEMRLQADDQLTESQNTNGQLVKQNHLLEAQLVAVHQHVEQLQGELNAAQNDFDNLMELHIGHIFPQPIAMIAPDQEEQGTSSVDFEAPLSPMDDDVLSDVDSHMPDVE